MSTTAQERAENNRRVPLGVALHKAVKLAAVQQEITIQEFVEEAVRDKLNGSRKL